MTCLGIYVRSIKKHIGRLVYVGTYLRIRNYPPRIDTMTLTVVMKIERLQCNDNANIMVKTEIINNKYK